jgi:hypothetical protein
MVDVIARRLRPVSLALVKGIHSAAFLVELAAIAWLLLTGIARRRHRSTAIAAALVAAEVGVFVADRGVCPLTPLAERLGAERGGVSDIFLPAPIARTIPIWSSALVALGIAFHVHALRASRRSGPRRAEGRARDVRVLSAAAVPAILGMQDASTLCIVGQRPRTQEAT